MSYDHHSHPTKYYVNCFLFWLSEQPSPEMLLHKSAGLPVEPSKKREGLEVPTFEHFRNRLKVMSKIDHLKPLAGPTEARFDLILTEEVGLEDIERYFVVHLYFDDFAPDPSIRVQLEYLRTETSPLSLK